MKGIDLRWWFFIVLLFNIRYNIAQSSVRWLRNERENLNCSDKIKDAGEPDKRSQKTKPIHDQMCLESDSIKIIVRNYYGKPVICKSRTINQKKNIDLSGQPKGMYFIEYYWDGELLSGTIIVR